MNLLISACLMGIRCRYDGGDNRIACIKELNERFTLVPVCPEVFGGMTTPRTPSERIGAKVCSKDGEDVTDSFRAGAEEALRLAKCTGCGMALLKERSPSCGCRLIYDGTFSGALREGDGVTAELLKKNGIQVWGESRVEELLRLAKEE